MNDSPDRTPLARQVLTAVALALTAGAVILLLARHWPAGGACVLGAFVAAAACERHFPAPTEVDGNE